MVSDHLDEPCLQNVADTKGNRFVLSQKADVKFDESETNSVFPSSVQDRREDRHHVLPERAIQPRDLFCHEQVSRLAAIAFVFGAA